MAHQLPRSPFLYPIIDSGFSRDPVADAQELIRAGVQIIQIRAKQDTRRRIYEITTDLVSLCAEHGVLLIVNDHVDVALVTNASGVHLGQDDFPVEDASRLLGPAILGLSTHNGEQFALANTLPIHYIALGPVYETTTKRSINPYLGLSKIIPLLKQKSKPVVAIGGIRLENVDELIASGVDGIALISELYREGAIYDTASRLLEKFTNNNRIDEEI